MADQPANLFWDSCVFYAYLKDERSSYDIDSIEQYLEEAKQGKHRIFTSSLVFAEVVPSAIAKPDLGDMEDFVEDFQGSITVITPSPNVMLYAGKLRDLPYRKSNSPGRRLSTPDAIFLASAIEMIDLLKTDIEFFHTFDDGKKRGPDGKTVPLISFEDWCEGFSREQLAVVQPVLSLNRRRPIHPAPKLQMSRGGK